MSDLLKVFELASTQGLFDAKWYCKQYHLFFENEIDAFADYLRKSRHSWVDPSPSFSSKQYFRTNLGSLLAKNISPLEHYFSRPEPRPVASPSAPAWKPRNQLQAAMPFRSHASYAITAHIYYPDYIDKLFNCLSEFQGSIDLFLTVSAEDHIEDIQTNAGRIANVQNVVVRVVPNRGRNFGPLLVEFGQILLNYDFFCHVHSKKSLFSGSAQEMWGDFLYEYLLQDKQILNRALALMEESDRYGIYFPTAFSRSLPKWATHVLSNKHSMQQLRQDFSLPEQNPSFLPYPVGGMFWARSDALRPLLERRWTYEDFPAEPLANDGTMLHGIERILVEMAAHRGYDHLVYHPQTGSFTSDSGHLTEEYIDARGDFGYIAIHSPHRIISFDLYDTLLYRPNSYPDQAKEQVPHRLGLNLSVDAFVALRNNTEYELRKRYNFQGDVSILDVYMELKQILGFSEDPETAADIEFQADLETYLPKSEVLELLHQAHTHGRSIYIVTDTYYTITQIRRAVQKLGIPDDCRLFVSSHEGARKDNGTIWKQIKKLLIEMGVDPLQEFIHIGDNVVSDAQLPGDHGLGTYHILNPFEKWAIISRQPIREHELRDPSIRTKYGPLIAQIGRSPFL